jgi:hypothetical protein
VSKKIDKALKALLKAFRNHAKVVGANRVPLKKAERATLKVQAAMSDYTAAVEAKTGLVSAFAAKPLPPLNASTLTSLQSERDALIIGHYANEIESTPS